MRSLDLKLQKPLEDYIALFEGLTERTLALFKPLLNDNAIVQDPYHRAMGYDGFQSIMSGRQILYKSSLRDKSSLRYRVHDFAWGRREDIAYIYWSMLYPSKRKKGQEESFEGMSELCFSKNGCLLSHCEFWGAHESFLIKKYKALKL